MKISFHNPARVFEPKGRGGPQLKDVASIELIADQQITLITESQCGHDFAAKDWGFYVSPSLNGRLKREGFKTALVKNSDNKVFLNFVEIAKMVEYEKYCIDSGKQIVEWLDEL